MTFGASSVVPSLSSRSMDALSNSGEGVFLAPGIRDTMPRATDEAVSRALTPAKSLPILPRPPTSPPIHREQPRRAAS